MHRDKKSSRPEIKYFKANFNMSLFYLLDNFTCQKVIGQDVPFPLYISTTARLY